MSFMDLCLFNFSLFNFFIDDKFVQLFLQTNAKLSLSVATCIKLFLTLQTVSNFFKLFQTVSNFFELFQIFFVFRAEWHFLWTLPSTSTHWADWNCPSTKCNCLSKQEWLLCYKSVHSFRVTFLFSGQYNTEGYGTITDVI